ncbi:hypothetical protein COY88_03500 [Candidatus Roizmanbacteria bacterium CG_4_10_14_0_8_um_filter_35_28]|uniref:50S ribosomal protein L28 n=2 Tax=Candidatus Roizmaniibacteriota TaxID=1752723 RepID=A0A2M7QFN7_9BACT|nr:MAG: hypothetical protein COY88_03500 [Candidatus Roizmanbacteria bacterium CG_4_10_14_0_8_um_filter_35_28]PJC83685.1 MAG: hypothetical protein CO006_00385 [Candidatus Roizmanbacteria bacterium CG_4_8_14_3_um_filter_35_14]PJE60933.1 MAG: hypothetical protein COU86_01745 [Candidatus Roizmanbacteria bacterium CG10_big_fil_rev_8_21_14_0_10_36_26]
MNSCYHCGKTAMFGRSHTHHRGVAGGRWKKRAPKTQRIFRVNFIRLSIIENGKEKRVKLCAKCLKRVRKDIEEGEKPFVTIANPNVKIQNPNQVQNPKP